MSCLRTSCLVPLDFRLGSRTGQTEEKGGEGARGRGDCSGVQLIGWKEGGGGVLRREYVRFRMEEAGLDMKMGTVDVPRALVLRLGW